MGLNIHASAYVPEVLRGEAISSCIAALLPYASLCCCWGRAASAGLRGAGDTRLGVGDATRIGVGLCDVGIGDKLGMDIDDMLLAGEAGLEGEPGRKSAAYTQTTSCRVRHGQRIGAAEHLQTKACAAMHVQVSFSMVNCRK
jgi:hypothetical protein